MKGLNNPSSLPGEEEIKTLGLQTMKLFRFGQQFTVFLINIQPLKPVF